MPKAECRTSNAQLPTLNVQSWTLDVGHFLEATEQPALGARTACAACPREPRFRNARTSRPRSEPVAGLVVLPREANVWPGVSVVQHRVYFRGRDLAIAIEVESFQESVDLLIRDGLVDGERFHRCNRAVLVGVILSEEFFLQMSRERF